jgi:hypothetical protein
VRALATCRCAQPCKTNDGEVYYFNFSTGESVWDHPCDEYYRKLYDEEKQRRRVAKTQQENARAQRQATAGVDSVRGGGRDVPAVGRGGHSLNSLKPLGALGPPEGAKAAAPSAAATSGKSGSSKSGEDRKASGSSGTGVGRAAAEREERDSAKRKDKDKRKEGGNVRSDFDDETDSREASIDLDAMGREDRELRKRFEKDKKEKVSRPPKYMLRRAPRCHVCARAHLLPSALGAHERRTGVITTASHCP